MWDMPEVHMIKKNVSFLPKEPTAILHSCIRRYTSSLGDKQHVWWCLDLLRTGMSAAHIMIVFFKAMSLCYPHSTLPGPVPIFTRTVKPVLAVTSI